MNSITSKTEGNGVAVVSNSSLSYWLVKIALKPDFYPLKTGFLLTSVVY